MECTVITPVGPGHDQIAQKASESVQAAAAAGMGPFERIHHIFGDDLKGDRGRSWLRNKCALERDERSPCFTIGQIPGKKELGICLTPEDDNGPWEAEWLFFLDADDVVCCPAIYGESLFEVAKKYVDDYDCIWGSIRHLDRDGQVIRPSQQDRITTYEAYVKSPAVLGCNFSHFCRRDKFLELGGFNEDLDVCEDVEWTIRAWKDLHCIKQEKPLYLHRKGHHSWLQPMPEGARQTFTGRDWSIRAEEMLKAARKELSG